MPTKKATAIRLAAVLLAVSASAQERAATIPDPFHLLEPKTSIARRASSNNPDPDSNDDSKRPIPGETTVLADLEGPMPFRKSCRVTITNEGRRRVANLYYQIDWSKVPPLPADTPYFHALYRQALPNDGGKPYEFLDVKGRGHYVGTVFSVVQAEAGWFGEGDDHFFVDGETTASLEGTGTEDYFGDAWSLHVSEGTYTGVPVAEGTGLGSRMSAYRWHLLDPIPFTKSLRFEIEHKGWTFRPDGAVKSAFGERTDLLSSVAFWYQQGIAQGLPVPPYGPGRLPQGNALQIEVDRSIGETKMEKGKVSVSPELFWSKDVLLFESEGVGGRVEVPFDVPADGDYEILSEMARGSDYGAYSVLLDGKPPQSAALEHEPGADVRPQTEFDGYAPETYVGAPMAVGWTRLSQGRHTLTFVCAGKREASSGYVLGVDDIVLARTGPAAWTGAAAVHAPARPSGGVADIARPRRADWGAPRQGPERPLDVGQRDWGCWRRGRARGTAAHRGLRDEG